MLHLETPTKLRLVGYEKHVAKVTEMLAYQDKKVEWALHKHMAGRRWFVQKHGEMAFKERLKALTQERDKTLLNRDARGMWTYSGLQNLFQQTFDDRLEVCFPTPEPNVIPWAHVPEIDPRYYQRDANSKLLAVRHGAVEIGTGLGKLHMIVMLLKELGLRAVVVAPTVNVATQAYDSMVHHFGKAKVGFVGDTKKEYNKLFTVAIAASLTKLKPGDAGWEALSKAQVFCFDESHLAPASTLANVCWGLLACAPYRFFFSATQMRQDGLDLVLDAITGPIVYRMTVREGVDQGFLAEPQFRMIWMESNVRDKNGNLAEVRDPNEMTRIHCYYNPDLSRAAAEMANKSVALMGRPTLIMVDELEQFTHLLPHLRYPVRFAHGGVTKDSKDLVPTEYHKSDPGELVEQFNAGEFPILVGTSCVTTGTNFKSVQTILNLRQGKSEIEVRQLVGRGTRLVPGKSDCTIIDFGIYNVDLLKRHAAERVRIYREIYPSVTEIRHAP